MNSKSHFSNSIHNDFLNAELQAQTMPPIETGVSKTLAKWRAAHYLDIRYKLNITLEKGAPLMKGHRVLLMLGNRQKPDVK